MATAPITKEEREPQKALESAATSPPQALTSEAKEGVAENLYLIGRPTLKRFLKYVKDHAVDPPGPGVLTEEWQAANEIVRKLEKEEADLVQNPMIEPVDPDNELLLEFLKQPLVKSSFNTVPTEVAFIDLDRLVVYQHHIDLTHVRQLKTRLGPAPTKEEIFHACLPCGSPETPVKWSRMDQNSYVFVSPSNDLRFLGVMALEPNNITDYARPGNIAGVVGLAVGFGSNFLNAIYAENRLILNNGSHRAVALRELGITRVPCIVQHVSSREELNVLACTAVTDNPNFFLQEPRPMMLKDYFDPRLRKVMTVHRRVRQIRVKFDIDQGFIPAL